jgi:hypothetical protein
MRGPGFSVEMQDGNEEMAVKGSSGDDSSAATLLRYQRRNTFTLYHNTVILASTSTGLT